MARITKERLDLAREFIDQWRGLERSGCDEIGWLMLKFSCSRGVAARLVAAVEQHTTTRDVGKRGYARRDDPVK
jgi:hypothetical protein